MDQSVGAPLPTPDRGIDGTTFCAGDTARAPKGEEVAAVVVVLERRTGTEARGGVFGECVAVREAARSVASCLEEGFGSGFWQHAVVIGDR